MLVTSEQDFQSAGFIGKASPSAGNIGFEEEVGVTLKAEQVTHVIESVPADNCKCLTSWDYQNKRVFDENGSYPCMSSGERSGADFTAVLKAEILDMSHANDVIRECGEVSPTLQARMGTGGNQIPLVFEPTFCIQGNTIDRSDTAGANGKGVIEGKSYTLNTVDRPAVAYAVGIQPNNSTSAGGLSDVEEKSPTLSVTKLAGVCYARSGIEREFVSTPIDVNNNFYVWIVRRLTPLECERLQGFLDNWTKYDTKGNEIKDTPRYKACGNSIAIPCAIRVFQGIVDAEKQTKCD